MKKRAQFTIHGDVQGVGFRHFARKWAEKLGLSGYVRNLREGPVEVAVFGDENTVRLYLQHLSRGPDFSYVSRVDENWEDGDPGEFSGFNVRF
ncbi:MAG: acylphosphatase [Chloroflexi bacterium]|nr:acylphosphatase [Chloroflexota bacterium]